MAGEYLEGLFGIEEHVANLESLLRTEQQSLRSVGIWGMPGIGKTTISRVLYVKHRWQYEASCFIGNVQQRSSRDGLDYLRNILVRELSYEKNPGVDSPIFTTRSIRRKKVLIVLDDVSISEQLEYLIGERDGFGSGSRIIVTSRDRSILGEVDQVYKVEEMSFEHAFQLFSSHAFKKIHPPPEWIDLSEEVVSYAKGLPLALKVLGSFLHQRNKEQWESIVFRLSEGSNSCIKRALKISYDGLTCEEQELFLDIACFLQGEDKDHIQTLLHGCGDNAAKGLTILEDKCLITISKDNKVLMHDLIRQLGQQIVREESPRNPGKRSRLWDHDVWHVLRKNLGTETVQAIGMAFSRIEELQNLRPDVFSKMHNLRFLRFRPSHKEKCNVRLPNGLEFLPDNLRMLHWELCPLKTLPSTYCPEKLIELNLSHSRIERLWDRVWNLRNLRTFDLSFSKCLVELPDLSMAILLESINLKGCTSLLHVSSAIFNLPDLSSLDLGDCKMLRSVQSKFHPRSIKWLNLDGCSSLTEFSVISENMEYLNLGGTAIKELPSSIQHLRRLRELILVSCTSLRNLPYSLSRLSCLELLNLSDCPQLEVDKIIPAFDGLKSLRKVYMDNCLGLTKLSGNISNTSSLNCLTLSGSNIETLPPGIKELCQLRTLKLKDCRRLLFLPELPSSIQWLNASGCVFLKTVLGSTSCAALSQGSSLGDKRNFLLSYQGTYSQEFVFYNCQSLNYTALRNILAYAWDRIQNVAFHSSSLKLSLVDNFLVTVCLPGSTVPDWFNYQTVNSRVTIPLNARSVIELKLFRFAFCLVLDASSGNDDGFGAWSIGCKCYLETRMGKRQKVEYSSILAQTQPRVCNISGHVYIWYDDLFCREILNALKERNENYFNIQNPKITFEFHARVNGVDRVKTCGVWVLKKLLDGRCLPSRL